MAKFLARNEELELEALFAVQELDAKMNHQPGRSFASIVSFRSFIHSRLTLISGFIRCIFDLLYDEDIIREDVFWRRKEDEREQGHAIWALSLKVFFDWLSEADNPEAEHA